MSAIEKLPVAAPEISERQMAMLEHQADVLAKSNLVGPELRGKPADIVMIGLTAHALEVPTMAGLTQIFPIKGRAVLSAQLKLALAQRAGHSVWFKHTDATAATICGQRKGEERVHEISVLHSDYKHLHGKDVWKQYPAAMLRARAVTALFTIAFTDVLLGMPVEIDATAHVDLEPEEAYAATTDAPRTQQVEGDEDIVDADLVEDDTSGVGEETSGGGGAPTGDESGETARTTSPTGDPTDELADDWDRESLRNRIASLPNEQLPELRTRWEEARFGSVREEAAIPLLKAHVGPALDLVNEFVDRAKEEFTRRRKRANALMGELGLKKDDDRHGFVREATGGATDSTAHLTEDQVEAIAGLVEQRKAEQAGDAGQDAAGEPEPDPQLQYAGDDPERPF